MLTTLERPVKPVVMPNKVQLTIDIVHRLDVLKSERAKLTENIDAQIAQLMAQLAKLTGDDNAAVRIAEHGAPKKPSRRGRGSNLGAKLYSLLAASPGADYNSLALQLYGSDSVKNRNRLRSLIMMLKKQGKVRSQTTGKWEVVSEN